MTYIWPVKDRVTQEFGANPDPSYQPDGHTGMDFGCPVGTPVYAEADGTIVISDWADTLGWPNAYYIATSAITPGGAGIVVGLDTGPYVFIHAHMSQTDRNNGEKVRQGDLLGYTGNTGRSTGPHLHLEILPDGWNVLGKYYGRINPRTVIDGVALQLASTGSPLAGNERRAGTAAVNQRAQPNTSSTIVRTIPAGSLEAWKGWVKGELVAGTDVWYKDDLGYASAAFFDPLSTAGLPDLTPVAPAPPPAPKPAPAPVTPKYDFVKDLATVNGITVEKLPAHWDNYGETFPEKPGKAVLHWWNAPASRPSIESVIGEFCERSTSKSPHFIVGETRVIQCVSLNDRAFHAGAGGNDWVGIEIDPYATEKVGGVYTARALKIHANVRGLLLALKSRYGYQLPLTLHKDVPGAATACSELVLADYDITPSIPVPPVVPTPVPAGGEGDVLRRFFEWLINLYMNRK